MELCFNSHAEKSIWSKIWKFYWHFYLWNGKYLIHFGTNFCVQWFSGEMPVEFRWKRGQLKTNLYYESIFDDNNRRNSLKWNSKLAISTPHTEHSTIAFISIFHRKLRKQFVRGMLTASEMNRLGIHWNVYINRWNMHKKKRESEACHSMSPGIQYAIWCKVKIRILWMSDSFTENSHLLDEFNEIHRKLLRWDALKANI